jgi:hypothetical protein
MILNTYSPTTTVILYIIFDVRNKNKLLNFKRDKEIIK